LPRFGVNGSSSKRKTYDADELEGGRKLHQLEQLSRRATEPLIFIAHRGHLEADWMADDAVSCEPVSAANSLLTGKLTGNFAESSHPPRFACLINEQIQ
jgi:hypothetical protein